MQLSVQKRLIGPELMATAILVLVFAVPVSVCFADSQPVRTLKQMPESLVKDRKADQTVAGDDLNSEIEAFSEPYRDISIAASEMGTVFHVNVREGDMVRAGDLLAGLDDQVLQAALAVARSSMNALGTLKSAEADVRMKKTELEKLKELRHRNHASQKEVDRIEAEVQIAEARVQSVMEDLEMKRLEAKRIEVQIEQRRVRSSIDGVVTEVLKDQGEFVSPSDAVIVRVVQLDPLLIVFSVPVHRRNELTAGQQVNLQISGEETSTEGTVEYVSPTPDNSNTSVRVKVRLPNTGNKRQSGERVVLLLDPISDSAPAKITPLAKRDR